MEKSLMVMISKGHLKSGLLLQNYLNKSAVSITVMKIHQKQNQENMHVRSSLGKMDW